MAVQQNDVTNDLPNYILLAVVPVMLISYLVTVTRVKPKVLDINEGVKQWKDAESPFLHVVKLEDSGEIVEVQIQGEKGIVQFVHVFLNNTTVKQLTIHKVIVIILCCHMQMADWMIEKQEEERKNDENYHEPTSLVWGEVMSKNRIAAGEALAPSSEATAPSAPDDDGV